MMNETTDLGPLVVFGTIWLVCGMIGGFGCAYYIRQWDDTWDEIADMWRAVPMMGPMMLVAVFDCRRRAKRHAAESATPHQHGAGNGEKHGE